MPVVVSIGIIVLTAITWVHNYDRNEKYADLPQCPVLNLTFNELKNLSNYVDAYFTLPKEYRSSKGTLSVDDRTYQCVAKQKNEAFLDVILNFFSIKSLPSQYCNDVCSLYTPLMRTTADQQRMSLLYHYTQCSNDVSSIRHCPNPCNSNPCQYNETNHLTGQCVHYFDPSVEIKWNSDNTSEHDIQSEIIFVQEIFQLNYRCECDKGHYWSFSQRICMPSHDICVQLRPCRNHGKCVPDVNTTQGFRCDCSVLFTGEYCEIPRDPCRTLNLCGTDSRFRNLCKQDMKFPLGYRCLCDRAGNYRPNNAFDQKCVLVNPCMDPYACLNGGTCASTTNGTHVCTCPKRFSGTNCQIYKFEPLQWSEWSIGECSQTCGSGHMSAYRQCKVQYECYGPDTKIEACKLDDCQQPQENEIDDFISTNRNDDSNDLRKRIEISYDLVQRAYERNMVDRVSREINLNYLNDAKPFIVSHSGCKSYSTGFDSYWILKIIVCSYLSKD
jgi:hypothetical protein